MYSILDEVGKIFIMYRILTLLNGIILVRFIITSIFKNYTLRRLKRPTFSYKRLQAKRTNQSAL